MDENKLPDEIKTIFTRSHHEAYQFLLKNRESESEADWKRKVEEAAKNMFVREYLHSQLVGVKKKERPAGYYHYKMIFSQLSEYMELPISLALNCAYDGFDEKQIKVANIRRLANTIQVDIFTTENVDPAKLSDKSKPLY